MRWQKWTALKNEPWCKSSLSCPDLHSSRNLTQWHNDKVKHILALLLRVTLLILVWSKNRLYIIIRTQIEGIEQVVKLRCGYSWEKKHHSCRKRAFFNTTHCFWTISVIVSRKKNSVRKGLISQLFKNSFSLASSKQTVNLRGRKKNPTDYMFSIFLFLLSTFLPPVNTDTDSPLIMQSRKLIVCVTCIDL